MVDEARYYKNVAIWLEKKGYYIGRSQPKVYRKGELFIRKGRKKAQVDVAGVRNVGKSYFDDIEIAIIEVKHSNTPRPLTLRELTQTRGYQIYAHNCYLATTDKISITEENKTDARSHGIGLLRIPFDFCRKKSKKVEIDDIEVILTPRRETPKEPEMLEFLATLDILRCAICDCYFNSWIYEEEEEYEEEFPNLPPKGYPFKRLERNKIFQLFPDKIEDQFNTKHKHRKSKMWRHLCRPCVEDLAKLYGIDKLKKDMDVLKKEIAKLKQ
jgi:hypothetical protein